VIKQENQHSTQQQQNINLTENHNRMKGIIVARKV
jgi:hypothetical protein